MRVAEVRSKRPFCGSTDFGQGMRWRSGLVSAGSAALRMYTPNASAISSGQVTGCFITGPTYRFLWILRAVHCIPLGVANLLALGIGSTIAEPTTHGPTRHPRPGTSTASSPVNTVHFQEGLPPRTSADFD